MHSITVHVELPAEHAWALAQFLKRLGFSDCAALAESKEQAHLMIEATEHVRRALAEAGYAPR